MRIILILFIIILISIFLIFLECCLIIAKREDEYIEKYSNIKNDM